PLFSFLCLIWCDLAGTLPPDVWNERRNGLKARRIEVCGKASRTFAIWKGRVRRQRFERGRDAPHRLRRWVVSGISKQIRRQASQLRSLPRPGGKQFTNI